MEGQKLYEWLFYDAFLVKGEDGEYHKLVENKEDYDRTTKDWWLHSNI